MGDEPPRTSFYAPPGVYSSSTQDDLKSQVLTQETPMFKSKKLVAAVLIAGLFAAGVTVKMAIAAGQTPTPAAQSVPAPEPGKVAAGSPEALKLLRLMDTDKNGKISRAEYMAFMKAEFDRLDVNHDGELDVKELEKSQLMAAHRGGTHR
jgi:hypothetical protein